MIRPRAIPVLLLSASGLVKTTRFKDPRYIGDPINALRIFNEKEVDEIVLLDIEAGVSGRGPDWKRIEELAGECFMPMAYGGGLRTLEDIRRAPACGVEKVILNTAAVETPSLVGEAAAELGSQSVVVSMDVRTGFWGRARVHSRNGQRVHDVDPVDFARQMAAAGAGEIIVHSVDRDGTMQGYDLELTSRVARAVDVPVVACGGAGTLDHLAEAVKSGASAVAAGSLFVYFGKHRAVLINYPSPAEWDRVFASAAPRS